MRIGSNVIFLAQNEISYVKFCPLDRASILLHDLMGGNKHPDYFMPLDSNPADEWGEGGPYRAVNELDKNKWEWMTIPVNHGLTLLRKKGKVLLK